MTADHHHERRWLILAAALGLVQLMVILDDDRSAGRGPLTDDPKEPR